MLASFQYRTQDDTDDGGDFCTTRIPFAGEAPHLKRATVALLHGTGDAVFAITITSPPEKP